MKLVKICLLFAFTLINAGFIPDDNYILTDDYIVTIHGTSNLHNWDEKVGIVTGNATLHWNSDESFDLNAIHIMP